MKIAIDGPAGSGKSTLAKAVAKRLGIYYLDTGSMYRGAAYAALQTGTDITKEEQVEDLMKNIDFCTVFVDGAQQNLYNGENVMPYIRTPQISTAASDISAYPCVRYKLVDMQRKTASEYDIVLDGRDIGTFVLPDADYKFYVTADVHERANRRYKENSEKGLLQPFEEVLEEMKQRDYNDSHRKLAPLKQADDAVRIDTTSLTIDEAIEKLLSYIKQESK
jgi:cytidylate kinase